MSELMLDVGQANELKMAFRRHGYSEAEVKKLGEGNFLRGVLGLLRGEYQLTPIAQAVRNTITVVSDLVLQQRIANGKYGWINSNINEKRFPHDVTTVGEWEYDLYHPNCDISSEDAKSRAEVDGFIVAKAEHLLSFGESFPEEQRKYPIIALGSVCEVDGGRRVLALWDGDGRRDLRLYCWSAGWDSRCRFLRVRKVQSSKT